MAISTMDRRTWLDRLRSYGQTDMARSNSVHTDRRTWLDRLSSHADQEYIYSMGVGGVFFYLLYGVENVSFTALQTSENVSFTALQTSD